MDRLFSRSLVRPSWLKDQHTQANVSTFTRACNRIGYASRVGRKYKYNKVSIGMDDLLTILRSGGNKHVGRGNKQVGKQQQQQLQPQQQQQQQQQWNVNAPIFTPSEVFDCHHPPPYPPPLFLRTPEPRPAPRHSVEENDEDLLDNNSIDMDTLDGIGIPTDRILEHGLQSEQTSPSNSTVDSHDFAYPRELSAEMSFGDVVSGTASEALPSDGIPRDTAAGDCGIQIADRSIIYDITHLLLSISTDDIPESNSTALAKHIVEWFETNDKYLPIQFHFEGARQALQAELNLQSGATIEITEQALRVYISGRQDDILEISKDEIDAAHIVDFRKALVHLLRISKGCTPVVLCFADAEFNCECLPIPAILNTDYDIQLAEDSHHQYMCRVWQ